MTNLSDGIKSAYRPAGFLAVTLAWTWGFWLLLAVLRLDPWQGYGQLLLYVGGVGPLVAALWFQARYSCGRGLRDLWFRLVQPGRAELPLWIGMVGLVPMLSLIAMAISGLMGGAGLVFALPAETWLAAFFYAAFILLLGPLPEEIGWRGYGLDALLSSTGPFTASMVLGVAWGAWHLPLFLINGYYAPFGGTPALAPFLWSILIKSVIMTWAYHRSDRSLLLMVMFHFMINFSGEVLSRDTIAEGVYQMILTLVAVVMTADFVRRSADRS